LASLPFAADARDGVFLGPRIDEVHSREVSRIDLVLFVEPAL
jgi:hypothetical protein